MAALEKIPQITTDQLSTMTPEQIATAHAAGQLAEVMGAPIPVRLVDNSEQLTTDDLHQLTPTQLAAACDTGQLTTLLTHRIAERCPDSRSCRRLGTRPETSCNPRKFRSPRTSTRGCTPHADMARMLLVNSGRSARRLQGLIGYTNWQNLTTVIARAMQTASNTGMDVAREFAQVGPFMGFHERTTSGQFKAGTREDYELTRHAAYLVAMNGDPNKPEVAAAQAYFAERTVQAESIEARA